uniref:Uncharacterized protein n=1 Tax=Siphoviridae sp. ctYh54 TaxID=2826379 RepID=A0A8S5ME70_9CAUD|nr:MAG TPA: hypothetical protein [Siphoviridae sp. ctYh54]
MREKKKEEKNFIDYGRGNVPLGNEIEVFP